MRPRTLNWCAPLHHWRAPVSRVPARFASCGSVTMGRPPRAEFESKLRQFRVGAGLTQDQLAEQLGVTTEMVRKHERGISLPIPLYRRRYAALFRVGENDIWLSASASTFCAVQTVSGSPLVHLAAG